MPKRLKTLLFKAVAIASCLALFEGLCSAVAWWKSGTLSVVKLHELDTGNAYTSDIDIAHRSAAQIARVHPWLGTTGQYPDHPESEIGNFPLERDDRRFTILFSGGSVAQLLGLSGELDKAFARYDFGGRDVRVLNAAMGAAEQPRQAIALLLYGQVADACITLDGWNEFKFLGGSQMRFDQQPPSWFDDLNPNAQYGFERLAAIAQTNQLKQFSLRHNSRAIYFATQALRNSIERSVPSETPSRPFLPDEWGAERRSRHNLEIYKGFLRSMHAMAKDSFHIKDAHFLQCCPAVAKALSAEELRVVGDTSYGDRYRAMVDDILALRGEGIDVVDLKDCFAGTAESVYLDRIHCTPLGYRIMSERIARELAKLWHVPEKKQEQ